MSNFTFMSHFSGFNSAVDISMEFKYGSFLGFTRKEIRCGFGSCVKDAAGKFNLTDDAMLDEIEKFYGGFRFDGATRVRNPTSTRLFSGLLIPEITGAPPELLALWTNSLGTTI